MTLIRLQGLITEDKKLQINLPDDVQPGRVTVIIEAIPSPENIPTSQHYWTDEEIVELTRIEPMTGREIVEWLKNEPP